MSSNDDPRLLQGKLVQRHKRFLIDLELADGTGITVHCPNTGSMEGCLAEGATVVALRSPNADQRKYAYTAEWIKLSNGWVGINTHRANVTVGQALRQRSIVGLGGYDTVRAEVSYPLPQRGLASKVPRSRADFLLQGAGLPDCYVEVKNATMPTEDGGVAFPDAVTERGRRHIAELRRMISRGHRAALVFVVNREDGAFFRPAWERDPGYSRALMLAARGGVEVYAPRVSFKKLPDVALGEQVPLRLEQP